MTFAPQAPWEQKTTRPTPAARESAPRRKTRGEDPVPSPGHSIANLPRNYKDINGWGADLDPKDRPSVPKELPSDVMTARGDVKHRQVPRTKVFHSNEHADLTPVFGETCPPSGLSGMLRGYAFQYGEATNRHWLTLMLADRVNVIERAVTDAFRGHPDNYIKEKGWSAKLKYDSEDGAANFRRTLTIGACVLGAVALGLAVNNAMKED
jgi:hypothetical protein